GANQNARICSDPTTGGRPWCGSRTASDENKRITPSVSFASQARRYASWTTRIAWVSSSGGRPAEGAQDVQSANENRHGIQPRGFIAPGDYSRAELRSWTFQRAGTISSGKRLTGPTSLPHAFRQRHREQHLGERVVRLRVLAELRVGE